MPMSKKELDALEERSKLKSKLTFPEKVDLLDNEELKDFHQKVLRHRRLKAEEEARWLSKLP